MTANAFWLFNLADRLDEQGWDAGTVAEGSASEVLRQIADEFTDRIEALEARNRALEEALRSAPHDFVSGCDADDGYHECNCYKAALDA